MEHATVMSPRFYWPAWCNHTVAKGSSASLLWGASHETFAKVKVMIHAA